MLAPDTVIQDRYRIVGLMGRGGMGAVYEAIDQRLSSRVALKQTLASSAELDQAFEREAKLLANLRHPALPKVSDYFTHAAGQFLVMEFIPGADLATLLARRSGPFPLDKALDWADALLRVLEYLHSQQPPVIHRDIKPQNLKLTVAGKIVLLDFGLAKGAVALQSQLPSNTILSGYTRRYAPLEQVRGSGTEARSDLYALAATLYHLLTNTLPADVFERASASMRGEPDPLHPLHEVNAQVPFVVSIVLMQAMEIDPNKRPASAAALCAALQMARVRATTGSVESIAAMPMFQTGIPVARPPAAIMPDTVGQLVEMACWGSGMGEVKQVAWSPDGQLLAAGSWDHKVRVWRANDGTLMHTLEHPGRVQSVAWSPDGLFLASGGGYKDQTMRLWRARDGILLQTMQQASQVMSVAWSPDGQLLAAGLSDMTVRLWRVGDSVLIRTFEGHTDVVHSIAFAPDGQTLASAAGGDDQTVRLWRVRDGLPLHTLSGQMGDVWSVALAPDSQSLASGSGDGIVRLWQTGDAVHVQTLSGHMAPVYCVAWSPDGHILASASHDRKTQLWRVSDGTSLCLVEGHTDEVRSVTFAPDGRSLATGSADGTVRLWGLQS
jgi:eukaryotic-like serine/threonine-protein kinase